MSKIKVDNIFSDNDLISFVPGDVSLDMSSSNESLNPPRGTTTTRPTTSSSGLVKGALRFNTTLNSLQYFTGWEWRGVDGTTDYLNESLVFYIDPANPNSWFRGNLYGLGWSDYQSNSANYIVNSSTSVTLKNTSNGWVGYWRASITTTGTYYITFDYSADKDGCILVIDNDGINDNIMNATLTANKKPQTYISAVNFTTTGTSDLFMRRDVSGSTGNITVSNVKLFYSRSDQIKDLSGVEAGAIRMLGNVTWEPNNYGILSFNGSTSYIDLPEYSAERPNPDTSLGSRSWNLWDVSMEIVVKQDSSKSLELFGTSTVGNTYPDAGFAYFPGGIGLIFYRFMNEAGDRPHRRAGVTNVSLSDGNWWHLLGTFDSSSGTSRLYINGSLVASTTTTSFTSSYQGDLGGNGTSYAYNGKVGLARIYNKALSASEVLRNYNSCKFRYGLS